MTMRVKFLIVALVGVILVLGGCCRSDAMLSYLPPDATVLAFGDSLTYGSGAARDQSYPVILEQLIGRKVINGGVSGLTAAAAMPKLAMLLEQYQPALVVLCIGGNDLLRRQKPEIISDNLEQLIRFILAKKIELVLIAVPKPGIFLNVPEFYQRLAKKYNLPIDCRTLPKLEGKRKYKADMIHLNASGYHTLAESVAALLRSHGAIF